MRYKSLLIFLILLMPAGLTGSAASAPQQTTVSEIKKSLVCLCECNMTVEACQGAMTCQFAEKLTAEATQYVEQGMSRQAVLATFTQKYGEHILAAPTKRGFNLTAWILPFAVIVIAGAGIIRVLKHWVRSQQSPPGEAKFKTNSTGSDHATYEKKLDEVLRNLD